MKNNSLITINFAIIKDLAFAIIIFLFISGPAYGGVASISSPLTSGTLPSGISYGSPGEPYIILAGTNPPAQTIVLSGSAAPDSGTVDLSSSGSWTNQNATPSSSTGATETITMTGSAIGQANISNLSFQHLATDGTTPCLTGGSNPSTSIAINWLQETLTINTSGWSQVAPNYSAVEYQLASKGWASATSPYGPPLINRYSAYSSSGPSTAGVGIPYEYIVTIKPDQSMASGSNMGVSEVQNSYIYLGGTGSISGTIHTATTNQYDCNPGATFFNPGGGPSPANPIYYAADSPGYVNSNLLSTIVRQDTADHCIYSTFSILITITSYPTYIISGTPIITGAPATKNFYFTGSISGTTSIISGTGYSY